MEKEKEFTEAIIKVMKVAAEQGIVLRRIAPLSFWLDDKTLELPPDRLLGIDIDPV